MESSSKLEQDLMTTKDKIHQEKDLELHTSIKRLQTVVNQDFQFSYEFIQEFSNCFKGKNFCLIFNI